MGDKTSRQEAYKFIKREIESLRSKIPEGPNEIVQLNNALRGTEELVDILKGLKDGTLDPTEGLITAFKDFVGPLVSEDQIDAYLIKPFISDP